MLVSKLRIFACHYFRWLEFRVSRSPGWVGGTHLLSKFSGACWAPPRASLPTSPSASHHSQSCHAMQWWPRWHLLCLQILHSPHFFQPQDKHLSIVQNDWGGGKKKKKQFIYFPATLPIWSMYDLLTAETVFLYLCSQFEYSLLLNYGQKYKWTPKVHRCFLWNITIEPQTPVISLLLKRVCKANQYYSPQTLNGTLNTPQKQNKKKTQTNQK